MRIYKIIPLLFALNFNSCMWQPPTSPLIEIKYPSSFIYTSQNIRPDGTTAVISYAEEKVSKSLDDIFIDETLYDVKITATKVSFGEYKDYGTLEMKLSGDFGEIKDIALLGDNKAEVQRIFKK